MSASWRATLLVMALVALGAVRARADARADYLAGRRDLKDGRTAEAAVELARAAAERPREEARARLVGAIPEPYLPWYYLGIAYARLDRCEEARAAWLRSDQYGVAAVAAPIDAAAAALRVRCQAPAEPAPRPSPTAVPASSAANEISGSAAALPLAPSPSPAASAPPGAAPPSDTNAQALLAAADRFADGDARGALAVLAQVHDASPRDQALAQLLTAAAHHALFELGGRRDPAELRQALTAARLAKRLAPALRPDATVFPPRFVDWYAGVR